MSEIGIFLIMFIVFIAIQVGYLIAKPKTKKTKLIEKAEAEGCVVQAERIKCWSYGGESSSEAEREIATYKYTVNGAQYTKRIRDEYFLGREEGLPFNIDLYYSKENPKKSVSKSEAQRSERDATSRVPVKAIVAALIVGVVLIKCFL